MASTKKPRQVKELKKLRSTKQPEKYDFIRKIARFNPVNTHKWNVFVEAPATSPYAGGVYNLEFVFPETYPHRPPLIRCMTKIYHMNVKENGDICKSMIENGWGPTKGVVFCVKAIYQILGTPNTSSPLRNEICALYTSDNRKYMKKCAADTKKYALKKLPERD